MVLGLFEALGELVWREPSHAACAIKVSSDIYSGDMISSHAMPSNQRGQTIKLYNRNRMRRAPFLGSVGLTTLLAKGAQAQDEVTEVVTQDGDVMTVTGVRLAS